MSNPRVFYRVARFNPPTPDDFTSNFSLGRVLSNPTQSRIRIWQGISVFESEALARSKARAIPQIGKFIVQLDLSDSPELHIERTFGEGHYTLWGTAEDLLACWVPPTSDV